MSSVLIFLLSVFLVLVTVGGDFLIKKASLLTGFTGWKLLLIGCIIYGATGIGWFYVLRKIKLSTMGVWYSIILVLSLTLISVFYFKEKISSIEIVGIILAIVSLVILSRFA